MRHIQDRVARGTFDPPTHHATTLYNLSGPQDETSNVCLLAMDCGRETNEKLQEKFCVPNSMVAVGHPAGGANMALTKLRRYVSA